MVGIHNLLNCLSGGGMGHFPSCSLGKAKVSPMVNPNVSSQGEQAWSILWLEKAFWRKGLDIFDGGAVIDTVNICLYNVSFGTSNMC